MANTAIWKSSDEENGKQVSFHVGDTVRVHYKLIEKEKVAGKAKREVKEETRVRTQVFEGIVISIKGEGNNKMFTVRRIGSGAIGIERIFPLVSPWIRKMEIKKYGNVRRSKLYYLRKRIGRAAVRIESVSDHKAEKLIKSAEELQKSAAETGKSKSDETASGKKVSQDEIKKDETKSAPEPETTG